MPRVSSVHRQARRDEIAAAAMRCLRRQGYASTTMADIIAESGLSSGAMYVNFENKAALVRYVASQVITGRVRAIEQFMAESDPRPSPTRIVELVLTELVRDDAPFELIVQFWGESGVNADLGTTVRSVMSELERIFAQAVLPWLEEREPDADHTARAAALASIMLALCQGFMVHTAVVGTLEPGTYAEGLRSLLAD